MEEDTKQLESLLRSLLISTSTVLTANTLEREYRECEARQFPFRKLGFSSFVDYLRSIPNVVALKPSYALNPDVHPVPSADSKHVVDLMVNTKKSKSKGARAGSLRRRDQLRRPVSKDSYSRSSTSSFSRPAPVTTSSYSRPAPGSIGSYSRPVSVSSGSSYSRPVPDSTGSSYSRLVPDSTGSSYSRPVPDLTGCSSQSSSYSPQPGNEDPRELLYELVCQVAQYVNGIRIQDLEHNLTRYHLKNSKISFTDLLHQALTRNLINREGNYVYPKSDAYPTNTSASHCNNDNNYDKSKANVPKLSIEDDYYDHEDWENMPEEALSKMTIEHFTQEPCNSTNQLVKSYCDLSGPEQESNPSSIDESDDEESNVSEKMIANFRTILDKNRDGFWLSELAGKYYEEFKVPLDYLDLGYTSAILLVEKLPEVFYVTRENSLGDWTLFDARYKRGLLPQIYQTKPHFSGERNVEDYIPKSILQNIKCLCEFHSNGFRSNELLGRYEVYFSKSLDWRTMGFKRLDDLIIALRNILTLIRVKDHYFILPKDHITSYPSNQELLQPDQALTLEEDSLPENVMGSPEDTIPSQELPPLKKKKEWSDPLLEVEIRISEVTNPYDFYFILCSEYNNLQFMMDKLDMFYKLEEKHFCIPPALVVPDMFVACLFDDYWHRAKIKTCYGDDFVQIEYIDYGTVKKVNISELRFLPTPFATFPMQAFKGQLLNIYPPNRTVKWPKESAIKFLKLVNNKRLFGQIFDIERVKDQEEKVHLMVIYDTANPQNEIIINEALVEEGFAMGHEEFAKYRQNQDCSSFERSLVEEEFSKLPHNQGVSNKTSLVNKNLPDPVARSEKKLKPPPGFEERSEEQFLPKTTTLDSYSTKSNHPYFPDQTQSNQTQSGIWDWYDNRPNPLTNHLPNVPQMPLYAESNMNTYMTYPNNPIPPTTNYPNIHHTREPSFVNQNQAQFNLIFNSNNLPMTVPNFSPNLSTNLLLPPSHTVRPPPLQMPFLPAYPSPYNYPISSSVLSQQAYLLQQQLLLQATLNGTLFGSNTTNLTSYSSVLPTPSEMTTTQLLNNLQTKPSTVATNLPKTASELSQFGASNGCKKAIPQSSLKNSSESVVLTASSVSKPSQFDSSTNCENVRPQPSIKNDSSVVVTTNTKKSKSQRETPSVHQSRSEYIMQEVNELLNELQANKTAIQIKSAEPSECSSKEESIEVERETAHKSVGHVELIRPKPALSPTSSEVKSIFKKSRRGKEDKMSRLSISSSKQAASACTLEEKTPETNTREKHGRLSSLSLLSSSSDEDYASCSENTNQSPFPAPSSVPDCSEDQVQQFATPTRPKLGSTIAPSKRNTDEIRQETLDLPERNIYKLD